MSQNSDTEIPANASNTERVLKYQAMAAVWLERAGIASRQNQHELEAAYKTIAAFCELLSHKQDYKQTPEFLKAANTLRKSIEAGEQHRTMCVEHGLSDAAIDATYEIQGLEKKLLELVLALVTKVQS